LRNTSILTSAAAVLALAAGGPTTARAETVAQTLKTFGLIGEWSKDCAAPTTELNNRTVFEAQPDGTVKLSYRLGARGEIVYTVTGARIISRQVIVLSETNAAGQPADVTVEMDGRRSRVLASRDPSINQSFIAGGVLLSTGRDTSWETLCR
jgi:hypothetical protein